MASFMAGFGCNCYLHVLAKLSELVMYIAVLLIPNYSQVATETAATASVVTFSQERVAGPLTNTMFT